MKKILSCMIMVLAVNVYAVNPTLNVQGVLRDASGNAVVDGAYDLQFFVYAAATGGATIYGKAGKLGVNTFDPAAQLHVGGTVSDVAVA
jgi:hypothetical protein